MKQLLIYFSLLVLSSCGQSEKKHDGQWKTIEVGDYLFDFPSDFELVSEERIDSYVGKIKGDSMCFSFDFGYYSNAFEQTSNEYLANGTWRMELPNRFMKKGVTYDQTNSPRVDLISIRPATIHDSIVGKGSDYVSHCKHAKIEFDYPVFIPNEIKQTNCFIDTIDHLYRKIVAAKDPKKGTTGIYLRELNGFNQSINQWLFSSFDVNKQLDRSTATVSAENF